MEASEIAKMHMVKPDMSDKRTRTISVRLYTPDDEPHFLNSIRTLQDYERQFDPEHMLPGKDIAKGWLHYTLEENEKYGGVIIVAEIDRRIVGFASVRALPTSEEEELYLAPTRIAYVSDVLVFSEFRRQGVGQKLMEEVERYAKERELEEIKLWVFAHNKRERGFYEGLGYEDLVTTMKKNLKDSTGC